MRYREHPGGGCSRFAGKTTLASQAPYAAPGRRIRGAGDLATHRFRGRGAVSSNHGGSLDAVVGLTRRLWGVFGSVDGATVGAVAVGDGKGKKEDTLAYLRRAKARPASLAERVRTEVAGHFAGHMNWPILSYCQLLTKHVVL